MEGVASGNSIVMDGAADGGGGTVVVEGPGDQPTTPQSPRLTGEPGGDAPAGAGPSNPATTTNQLQQLMEELAILKAEKAQEAARADKAERENCEMQLENAGLVSPPRPQRGPRQGFSGPGLPPASATKLGAFDSMTHLDGKTPFSQMVKDRVAVSPLAKYHPELFFRVCEYLQNEYPDAFAAVPPPASPAQGVDAPSDVARRLKLDSELESAEAGEGGQSAGEFQQLKCYLTIATSEGHCQTGKTAYTIVTAWLYYHFCGCHSFIAAWAFQDAPGRFIEKINEINEEMKKIFNETWSEDKTLNTDTPMSILEHLHILPTKEEPKIIGDYRCNVFVQLNNVTQLKKAQTFAKRLGETCPALKAKLGKVPLAMLMDEDDVNTQSATLGKGKREQTLHGPNTTPTPLAADPPEGGDPNGKGDGETVVDVTPPGPLEMEEAASLAAMVFSYVHISATSHATLIAAAVNGMHIHKIQRLTLPDDYLGYDLQGRGGWEIQRKRVAMKFEEVVVNPETGETEEMEKDSWPDMVTDGCKRLCDPVSSGKHQLAGRIVSQLICPMTFMIDGLEDTAEKVFEFACNELKGLGLVDADGHGAGVVVSTYHGSKNLLFCQGFTRIKIEDVVRSDEVGLEIKRIDAGPGPTTFIVTLGVKVVVSAPAIMNLFRELFSSNKEPMYTAVVARFRAGRSVAFMDSKYELHLTDGFCHRRETTLKKTMHDNLLQAMQRCCGRFPKYKGDKGPLPVRLWVTDDVWGLFVDAMRLHKQAIRTLEEREGSPYIDGIEFVWEHTFKPYLTKHAMNRALKFTNVRESGPRLVLLNGSSPEAAAAYTTLESVSNLAWNTMGAPRERLSGAAQLVAANRVAVVRVVKDNDYKTLQKAFDSSGSRMSQAGAKCIIKRLVGLDDEQVSYVSVLKDENVWKRRAYARLRTRGKQEFNYPSVAVMMEDRKLICFIFKVEAVRRQEALYKHGSTDTDHEGVKALAWWYPTYSYSPESQVLKLTLAVDLPDDVPTGRPAMVLAELRDDA